MDKTTQNTELLKHEYEIATQHYFFEGEIMLKRNQFFVALNLGLFSVVGFLISDNNTFSFISPSILIAMSSLGIIISFFWTRMTKRASLYVMSRVNRIKDIEKSLGYNLMQNPPLLSWNSKPGTWLLFIFLGYIFIIVWFGLIGAILLSSLGII